MFRSLNNLYKEFSPSEKRTLIAFLFITILSGLVQVVGIASIFPFISVATTPELIETNTYLSKLKEFSGISEENDFLVFLGAIVLLTLILSNAFLTFSTWLTMKFVVKTTYKFSYRLLVRYLGETYLFHLERNSAELIKNLISEVPRVINGGIMSALEICAKGVTCLFIIALLILVDPYVALIVAIILGGAYFFIYYLMRIKLAKIGLRSITLFGERNKNVNEALGGIKDLMVLRRQNYYLKEFQKIIQEIMHIQVLNRSAVELPKYIVETVAFGGILAITIYLISVNDNAKDVMPMIALYGFAGIRLMPALQAIFKATATLKHDISAVDLFYEDLKGTTDQPFDANLIENPDKTKLIFNDEVILEGISFTYPKSPKPSVSDLSLRIKKNTSLGIVGASGSGKSTLVDIILGLLDAQKGKIIVDGVTLNNSNIGQWQNDIGYVPQTIFLSDSTITENIAFGIPNEQIDITAVKYAAKMANIHDFIEDELEYGYQTITGERGIRLSGGQRQRIGIARALYHKPSLLIFDEATSALDGTSEKAVMDAVNELHGQITIIMIAHRLSTIMGCDNLVWMEKGKVKAQGTYFELMESNSDFRLFAGPFTHKAPEGI